MECNLIGTLTIFKMCNIVPNFSALARVFKKDRHTVAKMYKNEKEAKERKRIPSKYDPYLDEVEKLLTHPGIKLTSIFWYLKNEHSIDGKYSGFKSWVRRNNLKIASTTAIPHPLYETDPGDMAQNDWVEDISLKTINGDILKFNLFSCTLGYSRFHYFEYSEFKTEADYKRCVVHFFKKIGGLTKRILTDNMSAIVRINGNNKEKHRSILQFEKDLQVPIQLCKVRTPQTKGKDEVSNKYAQWLLAYDGKIRDKEHLLKLIESLNIAINKQVNTGTNVPPILLFDKEKEYLRPLPNNKLLDSYEDEAYLCKVPSTFIIYYKGSKYSVPPYLINKTVKVKEIGEKIYIYDGCDLVAEHDKTAAKKISYDNDHYKNGMIGKFKDNDSIEKTASENLARFKNIGVKDD